MFGRTRTVETFTDVVGAEWRVTVKGQRWQYLRNGVPMVREAYAAARIQAIGWTGPAVIVTH